MKSREIGKSRQLCDIIVEKFLELAEHIFYAFRREKEWTSHLTERYQIYQKYREKEFVKDFLAARSRVLKLNRYKMETTTLPCDGEENCIGQVLLQRGNKLISQASLRIKDEENKLIYWSFEKSSNTK